MYIKGGPFRSRIAYKDITRVSPSHDVFTGYRVLSSRDGLELFYTTGLMGSVKISPEDQGMFLKELQERAPDVQIDSTLKPDCS
nr:PH domain-containing protein [Lentibacillus sp. JNUCC-1]